jgi:hypothetical protein
MFVQQWIHVSLASVADRQSGGEYDHADRLTDRIGLGVLTRLVHRDLVDEVLADTGRTERRRRRCRPEWSSTSCWRWRCSSTTPTKR